MTSPKRDELLNLNSFKYAMKVINYDELIQVQHLNGPSTQ